MKKILEAIPYRRLTFVNKALQEYKKYNNGFISSSRTSDKSFILMLLLKRHYLLGKDYTYISLSSLKHLIW